MDLRGAPAVEAVSNEMKFALKRTSNDNGRNLKGERDLIWILGGSLEENPGNPVCIQTNTRRLCYDPLGSISVTQSIRY